MGTWIVVFIINWEKKYSLEFYDFSLKWLNKGNEPTFDTLDYNFDVNGVDRHGVFFKSCQLKDYYAFFIYYLQEAGTSLKFRVLKIDSVSSYTDIKSQTFSDYNLNSGTRLNDLVKINDERVAFFALSATSNKKLYIFLIDFFDNYQKSKIRHKF